MTPFAPLLIYGPAVLWLQWAVVGYGMTRAWQSVLYPTVAPAA
jgi:hypothetical protein